MNKAGLWFFSLCFSLVGFTQTVSMEDAILQIKKDVEESTHELNSVRTRIHSERLLKTEELEELRKKASLLRAQIKEIRGAKDIQGDRRQNLLREVENLEAEKDFVVESVVGEYRRSLSTRVPSAELQLFDERLDESIPDLFKRAIGNLDRKSGGHRFGGIALDENGREIEGEYIYFGPVGFFLSEAGAGITVGRPGSVYPGFSNVKGSAIRSKLEDLVKGEEVGLPVDVSGGDALKVNEAQPTWIEQLQQGGVVVIPLLGLGLFALVLTGKKLWQLSRMQVDLTPELTMKLRQITSGTSADPEQEFTRVSQPLGSLLTAAVRHRHISRIHMEEILHEHVMAVVPRLESSLGALAVLGGVAPLLGLLGTVTGMIHTFMLVKVFGTGNTQTLSGGISEALVTTALGLILAIPILLVHAFLTRKAKTLLARLEQSGVSMVNLLTSDSNRNHEVH